MTDALVKFGTGPPGGVQSRADSSVEPGDSPWVLVKVPSVKLLDDALPLERAKFSYSRLNGVVWVLGDISSISKSSHNWIMQASGQQVLDSHFTLGFGSFSALGIVTGSFGMLESYTCYRTADKIDHVRGKMQAFATGTRYFGSTVSGSMSLAYRFTEFQASQTASKTAIAATKVLGKCASGAGIFVYTMMSSVMGHNLKMTLKRYDELDHAEEKGEGFEYLVGQLQLSDEEIEHALQCARKGGDDPGLSTYPLDPNAEAQLNRQTTVGTVMHRRFRAELVKKSKVAEANFASDVSGAHVHRVHQCAVDGRLALTDKERQEVLADFKPDYVCGDVDLHPVDAYFAKQKAGPGQLKALRGQIYAKSEGVKASIVDGAKRTMRKNIKALILAITICVLGAAITTASFIVTGGAAGLALAILGDVIGSSMIGIDIYGMIQSFKHNDAGKYDHLVMTAISVILVAAIAFATIFSAGLVPLVIAAVGGALMLTTHGYLCLKTHNDQKKPLSGSAAQAAIGTAVNTHLDLS